MSDQKKRKKERPIIVDFDGNKLEIRKRTITFYPNKKTLMLDKDKHLKLKKDPDVRLVTIFGQAALLFGNKRFLVKIPEEDSDD
jgi:hypothetical protein